MCEEGACGLSFMPSTGLGQRVSRRSGAGQQGCETIELVKPLLCRILSWAAVGFARDSIGTRDEGRSDRETEEGKIVGESERELARWQTGAPGEVARPPFLMRRAVSAGRSEHVNGQGEA
jgi:hypothetical protein